MIKAEMDHWEERWKILRSQIDQLKRTTEHQLANVNYTIKDLPISADCNSILNEENGPEPSADLTLSRGQRKAINALCELLAALKDFGEEQFGFFKNEFAEPDPSSIQPGREEIVEETTEYPQEHVMRVTLDQLGYDLWVISHAISQRFSQIPGFNATLEKADLVCMEALKPAEVLGLGLEPKGPVDNDSQPTRVISYFLKSPSIRVVPYANTALIGVPQTAICKPRDLLAIPHEIGHYVYWHGLIKTSSDMESEPKTELVSMYLEKNIPDVRYDWAERWLEEIFADIYGSMVAGPVLALSFQELHLQQSQSAFFEDDGDHPPPILRPNIYAKGVHLAGCKNWAKLLAKRWNEAGPGSKGYRDRLKKIPKKGAAGSPDQRDYHHEFRVKSNSSRNVSDAISMDPSDLIDEDHKKQGKVNNKHKPVDSLIKFIFDNVLSKMDILTDNWWRTDKDGAEISDGGEPDRTNPDTLISLFGVFEEKVGALNLDSEIARKNQETAITAVNHETLKKRWLSRDKDNETDPDWVRVFDAEGWTTEGPHSNPPGP